MRKKLFNVLNTVYSVLMFASFFAGFLPFIPILFLTITGINSSEKIMQFFKNDYYPYVIIVGAISIIIGVIAMYIGKIEELSIKSVSKEKKE